MGGGFKLVPSDVLNNHCTIYYAHLPTNYTELISPPKSVVNVGYSQLSIVSMLWKVAKGIWSIVRSLIEAACSQELSKATIKKEPFVSYDFP